MSLKLLAKNPVLKRSQTTVSSDDATTLGSISCQTKVMKILLILAVLPSIQGCSSSYGELGEWSSWTDCSQTCGHSVKTRTRNCSTKKCNGIQIEAENCPDLPPCSTTLIIISILNYFFSSNFLRCRFKDVCFWE